jgi:hypothetical protein
VIRLRFVRGRSAISNAIIARSGICMPFTPSHVEAVSEDGQHYIGQHIDGGLLARPAGYDGAAPEDELFLDLPATDEQTTAFYAYMTRMIGMPYDWRAIINFVGTFNVHVKDHAICSAIITLALRTKGCEWFPSRLPLCVPAHNIDPRDLLLMISAIVEVPH